MEKMNADGDLIRSTESFMSGRSVSLVIDGHLCEEKVVEIWVPQGLPVSLILFGINLSREFIVVEKKVE